MKVGSWGRCVRSPLGSEYRAHQDLHAVVDIDEPGDIRRTVQDENGVPRRATQFHRYGHCPGPAVGGQMGCGFSMGIDLVCRFE